MDGLAPILAIFTTPVPLTGVQHLLLLAPLCVAISIVYKTLRCEDMSDVPRAALGQSVTVILAMVGVGVAVWLLYLLMK
ncbi:MAG: hypothetical protein H6816_12350 [Phycisphaerales bacterium]|nr:hypothetical protein [Phycisphaerales bacterium]